MNSRIKYFVVSTSSCLTVLLLVGSALSRGASSTDDTLKHIGVFSEVVAHIKSEYVDEPDMKSVTLGALNGMLEAIDPFASYLNADQYKEYLKTKDQKRADVGLLLSKRGGYLMVVGATPGSSAAKAGMSSWDMIETIKGIATRDMPLAYAQMLLQGDPNSSIDVSVVRARHPEPQTVKLTRTNSTLPPIESKMLAGQVGYINIDALSPAHVKDVATAVQKLQRDGAEKFVLDVRNCSLGSPEDGVAAANLFLGNGMITYLQGQRVTRQNFEADPAKQITSKPVVVLTNRGTAQAAEVLAGALGENNRAQIVGERTYGDAAQRKAVTMDDGGAVILSVAKYYLPKSAKAIQDTGVTPGTAVADTESQIEFDDNGEPIVETPEKQQKQKLEDDPVVKKALELLGSGSKA
jgi:carboxyl-terminal processing protease